MSTPGRHRKPRRTPRAKAPRGAARSVTFSALELTVIILFGVLGLLAVFLHHSSHRKGTAVSSSTEARVLESVIEEDSEYARQLLASPAFLNGELVEFHDQLSHTLDLVNAEITRRGGNNRPASLWESTPVADTGPQNIIRGTE